MKPLQGKIAVVAGATRGAGRGIACMLGEAGATVYCTGRSTRKNKITRPHGRGSPFKLATRSETIEETAEMVNAHGGKGIAAQVDHTIEAQVKALFAHVKKEQKRLDILVNDVWGGDELNDPRLEAEGFGLVDWKSTWELSPNAKSKNEYRNDNGGSCSLCSHFKGLLMLQRAVHSHIITSRYGAPLMVERKQGLIVEITDGESMCYRGNLFYDLVKTSIIRLAFDMAQELSKYKITALALTPGFLRSEAMLDHFGVTETNWPDGAKKDPHFIASETPFYVGRAVAALASDPKIFKKTGKVFSSWRLAREYGFTDIDGRQPDWGKYFDEEISDKRSLKSHEDFIKAFQ
ncbi:SDR family NAD(P)-dependent oxidoreductase [Candidatus Acetothermia bacterium]|nr:SDR family NAD(P)-dependent oxidoreductase [Candidatus Acetothermia bacterium]